MRRPLYLLALLLTNSISASAQNSGNEIPMERDLALPEVISLALNRNLSLKRSSIQIRLRENTVVAEEANFDPSLTASAGGRCAIQVMAENRFGIQANFLNRRMRD